MKKLLGKIYAILLLNKKATPKSTKPAKKSFNALKLKTKGFKFNREDIYRSSLRVCRSNPAEDYFKKGK